MRHRFTKLVRGGWRWIVTVTAIAALAIACATLLWSGPLLQLEMLVNPDALLTQCNQADGRVSDPSRCPGSETVPVSPPQNLGRQ